MVTETRYRPAGHATGKSFDREPIEKATRRVYALVHAHQAETPNLTEGEVEIPTREP